MALGRRKIRLEDEAAWVFNRMADVYDARPAYPHELVATLAQLSRPGGRVADVGAGIGHLAIPLAMQGLQVVAIEPARIMLERLRAAAVAAGVTLGSEHATAEALPLADKSVDLMIVADALHFLDAERCGLEAARVLSAQGALALITCELADTPFMHGVVDAMREAAPRRPRDLTQTFAQVSALAQVPLTHEQEFVDHVPVEREQLERILRSISFIGPAMNEARFAQFRARIHALPHTPVWSRRFTLRSGQRR